MIQFSSLGAKTIVIPLIVDKLRRNIIKVAVEPRTAGSGSAVNFDNVMT